MLTLGRQYVQYAFGPNAVYISKMYTFVLVKCSYINILTRYMKLAIYLYHCVYNLRKIYVY